MESADARRPGGDVLPSIYGEFEQQQREGAAFHQRHPSIARASISSASPVSPTTMFGGPRPYLPACSQAPSSNGIATPPDSRRTSDDPPAGRQSLPSLHEALSLEKPSSFSSPQTPPIGGGSFSAPSHPPRKSLPGTIPVPMPRSQTSDPGLHSHPPSQPPTPHGHPSAPPPYPNIQGPPPPPSHEPYSRHDSQSNGRSMSHSYSHSQPPPSIPAIHPPELYAPSGPPPPPPPSSSPNYSPYPPPHGQQQQSYSNAPQPHYPPPAPYSSNGPVQPQQQAPPPPSNFSPYRQPQPPHQSHSQPPPPPQQPSYQSHPPHSYNQGYAHRDSYPSDTSNEPPKGVKRPSGYGVSIERALSMSAIRRDLDQAKDYSARMYHIIENYQLLNARGHSSYPGGVHQALQEFQQALQMSQDTTNYLLNCTNVLRELAEKEIQEHNSQKMISGPDYGPDDGPYQDDVRSNGSQQPEKKIRRGRAAPPGRCHSCHRAETPEWRRGPDGARTLCNACGLHYAKLTRKLSKNTPTQLVPPRKPNSPLP
ncbi:hypothetical protein FPQ18DRAFT_306077 [Pyronema domesticum]|uniref:Similar to GATA zinc finger domain-containing protein 10 acc. no. Q54TE3 n=1 Tax=Pyronema omphalodes (strain CBS 100304) TaxID=1076935 RepID=U4LAE8_PYROM|nr:hypothetical protein FPQ18DRAFT_306077 [Pyronema domesticum]CCX07134.1 Similar to GATA zinc finger domain-containing protein 10; acc. no. Q54TE3 [Pyronema omphalodes CBS 100304]